MVVINRDGYAVHSCVKHSMEPAAAILMLTKLSIVYFYLS